MSNKIIETKNCKFVFPFQTVQENIVKVIQQKFSSTSIQILFSSQQMEKKLTFVWKYLQSCSATSFEFSYNSFDAILKQIQHVKFDSLKQLSLQNNFISNIQSLISINASLLQQLSLSKNKIRKVGCLKKNYFQNLNTLNLKQNPISQLKGIEFLNLNQLRIQDSTYDKLLGQQNISFLLKMQDSNLKILRIQAYDRMKTPKIDQIFKRKNTKIWIYRTQIQSQMI